MHFLDDYINFSDYSVLKYNYSTDYKISQTSTLEKKAHTHSRLLLLLEKLSLVTPLTYIIPILWLICLHTIYHYTTSYAFICYFILCIPHKDVSSTRALFYFCGFPQFPQPLSRYLQTEGAISKYLLNEFLLYFAIKPGLTLASCCCWKPCPSICLCS